jgi:hypothetical protein
LNRFEGRNSAGSGLFFIFNFKKICFGGKDPSEYRILELLPSGGLLERDVPTLALHGINGDSAKNYHLMDEESTGGIVIPPEITRSLAMNLTEVCLLPPGITRSDTRNQPEEWDSAGNPQLIEEEGDSTENY